MPCMYGNSLLLRYWLRHCRTYYFPTFGANNLELVMRGIWWKICSAILLVYSVIFGLLTPLNPGIRSVNPAMLEHGANSIQIVGYNTHFADAADQQQVWLRNDSAIFCSYELAVIDNTQLRASFSVDDKIKDAFFDVYVHNAVDGTMHLPDALLQKGFKLSLQADTPEPCLAPLVASNRGFRFPNQPILNETIRNLLFHVPSWFAMILLMGVSIGYSIVHLRNGSFKADMAAANAAKVGLFFAFIGLATGMIWARFTWGAWWVNDRS